MKKKNLKHFTTFIKKTLKTLFTSMAYSTIKCANLSADFTRVYMFNKHITCFSIYYTCANILRF